MKVVSIKVTFYLDAVRIPTISFWHYHLVTTASCRAFYDFSGYCYCCFHRFVGFIFNTLPQSIEDLPKRIILTDNSLARIIQLVRPVTFGSQVRLLIQHSLKQNMKPPESHKAEKNGGG